MAAHAKAEAERALLEAQRRCEAAVTAVVAAADAAARVSPVAQVTPAVTRSRSALSAWAVAAGVAIGGGGVVEGGAGKRQQVLLLRDAGELQPGEELQVLRWLGGA